MFIPRGKVIHENLATSYVLLEALVADLGEGGFSGMVEVVLRETDSYVIIDGGEVAAVIERRLDDDEGAFEKTTTAQLAARSLEERGRISVYAYSAAIASLVAGLVNAQTLYAGLSTEFTDFEKMISKLARERDREWFVEVNVEDGSSALVHLRDGCCRVITPTGAPEDQSDALELADNAALTNLLHVCNRAGGTFNVYFKRPAEVAPPARESVARDAPTAVSHSLQTQAPLIDIQQIEASSSHRLVTYETPAPGEPMNGAGQDEVDHKGVEQLSAATDGSAEPVQSGVAPSDAGPVIDRLSTGPMTEVSDGQTLDLTLESKELPAAGDAEAMAEVKRLMGEIARTIEEAAQAVGRPDSFAMSLRAGQLKVAERYPFLDPFAGEFEYLSGEIVFIGQANPEAFITGLTEALKLATESVRGATQYADRFRAYVIEDLQKLLSRNRADFDRFGLDHVIAELVAI
ncbi:MAG: hypothetical protein WAV20_01890 [Blastocatellia bacterium]